MATLSFTTLQQRWHCNAQCCYCYDTTGIRNNAATTTRNSATTTRSSATTARYDAVQRCWSSQRWRCCAPLLQLTAALCNVSGTRNDGAVAIHCNIVQRCQSSLRRCAALLEFAAMALCSVGGARSDGTAIVTCCGTAAARNVATCNITSLRHAATACNVVMLWCYGATIRVARTRQRWQAVLSCSASMATVVA